MISTALARIPVGVLVERRRAQSPWLDFVWRPVSVLVGVPTAAPWTEVSSSDEQTTFYAGEAVIELHRTETASYIENLGSGNSLLWVALRRIGDGTVQLLAVTADPAEGEGLTGAGDDVVETVAMPSAVAEVVGGFIAEYHVERPFIKRKRERFSAEAPRRPAGASEDEG